ncbi:unnamed protein product [Vitrella brassicaformis CCMP3155]|uniref:Uncharacterized protein n=1 Tax=Vitrella brassicaformis (strain CCMP3155) TaxID=1169540 RepID=A0A0G4ESS1_VITBC|nr:unnamed protein product [Vitrella brassicaformis CCMP3155]|eukprot:CEM00751.1 unnamed protein product [Vitrella brassicaformis CCMP3155]
MQQPQHQQQHPFSYIFVGRRTYYLFSSIKDILRLRATCTWLRNLFGAAQLRDRLRHSLGSQTGLRRAAYVSVPRMLAQLKMVGRHVHFIDGTCLQLFHHGNGEVRAITDEPGFELEVDPPLPAGHLYQEHRQPHDPPVRESIYYYEDDGGWEPHGFQFTLHVSVSSFAKQKIIDVFEKTQQINYTYIELDRYVGGGRLDALLTESPHTPVAGCTTTVSSYSGIRFLVLTNSSHNFVAWVDIAGAENDPVSVYVETTETAVCGSGAFKHRFPMTTQLARVALGAVAPYVFDGQVQQQQQQDDDSDDSDSDGDESDDVDEGGGCEGGVAEEESGSRLSSCL